MAIGSPYSSLQNHQSGLVVVYTWNPATIPAGSWDLVGPFADVLVGDGETVNDRYGLSASLSSDGTRIAIGAPKPNSLTVGGLTKIYDFNGTNWVLVGSAINGEAVGDQSGTSVFLNSVGDRVVIGSPHSS